MKAVYLLFGIFLFIGCKKDSIFPLDFCPLCTSIVEVNGQDFDSKPINAFFKYKPPKDTFFIVEIQEKESLNDNFRDVLLFWRIPYQEGTYKLNDSLNNTALTDIRFTIIETEIITPSQIYSPDYNGESIINVTYLNKITGEYKITFNVFLYPDGNVNNPLNNNSYPNIVNFIGESEGYITP